MDKITVTWNSETDEVQINIPKGSVRDFLNVWGKVDIANLEGKYLPTYTRIAEEVKQGENTGS